MRIGLFIGIACAIVLHVGVVLFGGAAFVSHKTDYGTLQKVELLGAEDASADKPKEKPKKEEPATEKKDAMKTEEQQVPDAAEVIRNLDLTAVNASPALDTASLSEMEAMLNGAAGAGGDFARAVDFASGGIVGGHGKAGVMGASGSESDRAFDMIDIDQKPQQILAREPVRPASMHDRKTDDFVTVLFVVDASGKVVNPRVEKSSHRDFEKPVIDAVRTWKFEPAIKGGQHVACRVRRTIRFPPSQRG